MEDLPYQHQANDKQLRKSFRNSQPFWNGELASLWFTACQAERNYLDFKVVHNSDLQRKGHLKSIFSSARKQFDRRFRYFKRQHSKKEQEVLFKMASESSPEVWKEIKKLNCRPSKPILEIVKEDGTTSRKPEEIVEKWYKDISQLFSNLKDNPDLAFDEDFFREILRQKDEFEGLTPEEQRNYGNQQLDGEMLNNELQLTEVSDAVDKLKLKKAYLDIPNEVMKNPNAKALLHKLLNNCFVSGISPTDWQYSDIKPIPKPDKDTRDPLQNRCITIMCCVAKLYSSILNTRLQSYMETNKIFADEQNGFRRNRSCIDHLFTLVTVLRNRKELGKDTFLAFIDYRKAFDSVERGQLFYKLARIGVVGRMYKAISSLYTNPRSRVILEDLETDYFNCPVGVKQGDCLSPTLFSIYINDLVEEINRANLGVDLNVDGGPNFSATLSTLLYADDIVCLASNENDLQDILFIIQKWCQKWRLDVNMSKTNIMHIRNSRKPQSKFTFLFDCKPVAYCSHYKYLGCNINEFLNFTFTVDKQAESAGRALGAIIAKMIKNNGFPLKIFALLYNACVVSIMDYSSGVTGFQKYQSALNIHLRAIRSFLGAPKNACNPGVLSEIDLLLPQFRTKLEMVRLYHRLLYMDNDRLTRKIMLWDKKLNEDNIVQSWTNDIKQIFIDCNLMEVFESETGFNKKHIIETMRSCFLVQQRSLLQEECLLKPKLRTFLMFKDFDVPPVYVGKPLSHQERRILARTRLGCLPLRIETGRYCRPRLIEEERTCLVCKSEQLIQVEPNQNPIENETHFLFSCSAYSAERNQWLSQMKLQENFQQLPEADKLKTVLNEGSNLKATSQFILKALNIRSTLLP